MRERRGVALGLWVGLGVAAGWLGSCTFGLDPDRDRFSCATDEECGESFECIPQVGQKLGLCFPSGECAKEREVSCDGRDDDCNGLVDDVLWTGATCDTGEPGLCQEGVRACEQGKEVCLRRRQPAAEVCDGKDNDCDGRVDEDFDLASNDLHCGACGVTCPSGTTCQFGSCIEVNCSDGVDNDADGLTDCEDPSCLGRACGPAHQEWACALVPQPPADAGWEPDAGVDPDAGEDADAGEDSDAGFDPDAGEDLDAGFDPDAGEDPDAGFDPDGGFAPDAGGEPDAGGQTDAGTDGGEVLVPACVPRESSCADGKDNDGDSLVDCEDPDCEGRPCAAGGRCQGSLCQ